MFIKPTPGVAVYILNKMNKLDPDLMLKIMNTRFEVSKDKTSDFLNDEEIICGEHNGKITVSLLSIINSILVIHGVDKVCCLGEKERDGTITKINGFTFLSSTVYGKL